MKLIILTVAACVAMACAAPQVRYPDVRTVNEVNENDGTGFFRSSYALSDGTTREDSGSFTPISPADPARNVDAVGIQRMEGVISWTAPDGQVFHLRYVADENGFRPIGDHLPKG